jgi:hypothetical protein
MRNTRDAASLNAARHVRPNWREGHPGLHLLDHPECLDGFKFPIRLRIPSLARL